MQKNAEKYTRHEILTNNFLVQLAYAIAFAVYTFMLMKGSATIDGIIIARTAERICFIVFAILAVILLFVWLKGNKNTFRNGFLYSLGFSLGNLYIILYPRVASKIFGGFFYNIMNGEFKTLLIVIGIFALVCFISYIVKDSMPVKKAK